MDSNLFSTHRIRPADVVGPLDSGPLTAPTASIARPRDRALVLGGGGSAGNAWLIGIVAGLSEAGLDVTGADLVVGTSAGSTAAAQVTTAAPAQLLDDVLSAPTPARIGARPLERVGNPGVVPAVDHLRRTSDIIAGSQDPADMRRRLGAAAMELDGSHDEARRSAWRATVASRFAGRWPESPLLVVAVDAGTGEPVVFDRDSGVDLVDAVAASCSSGPAYRIGDRYYIDGGYRRSSENADLAAGYARVLVLSPLGGRTRAPREWGMALEVQAAALRAEGSVVECVLPDSRSLEAFGTNLMDLSTRPAAAAAGRDQGRALAPRLTESGPDGGRAVTTCSESSTYDVRARMSSRT